MSSKVPNVQLINQCNEISSIKGNLEFKSMSSNNTHFGTLTNDNEVIFEWKNEMNQQIGLSVSFDSALNCYNILLPQDFSIIIDCYYNNEFLLIQLSDELSKIAYSIESIQPTQTKIKSIIKGTNAFIYMPNMIRIIQYFHYFHQLLQLKQFKQLICRFRCHYCNKPQYLCDNIYQMFQLSISPDAQIYQKTNLTYSDSYSFRTVNVYYNYWSYSQVDSISQQYIFQDDGRISFLRI
ncbi:unnamed protein product [Paramecium sonneborni]|uniref:Uncharacterized protein n=1 Tax=Paramecium sonneborni TaxID=65129 RepID=A0A8S1RQK9_9CILI|nr:unnamed protein product [Paramecium sonneborni]